MDSSGDGRGAPGIEAAGNGAGQATGQATAVWGPLALLAVWTGAMVATILLSIRTTGWELIYTLDDPYIHLALAENIIRGHFGVNLGEVSSPSSSILFPLLLGVTEMVGLGALGPAVLTIPAAGASVWLGGRLLYDRLRPAGLFAHLTVFGLGLGLILAMSAVALPLTGMEHSLHVLASILALAGLLRAAESGRCPGWLVAVLVVLPLLRFEGLALSGATILALVWLGQWRPALLATALILAALSAFGATMAALGLPPLPSSVMAKHDVSAGLEEGRGILAIGERLARRTLKALSSRQGAMIALGALALLLALPRPGMRQAPEARARLAIGLVAAAAIGAQIMLGGSARTGFYRYEIYAMAIAVIALVVILAPALRRIVNDRGVLGRLAMVAILPIVAMPSARAVLMAPASSRNMHEQQFQMHRFATEYFPKTVAVNDLGWVSYQNDGHVLDLWGLGSEEARKARAGGTTPPEVLDELVRRQDAAYAMIYQQWFPAGLPESWCPVAVLETSWVTAAFPQVLFLATRPDMIEPMRAAVRKFRPSLPPGARIRAVDCDVADPLAGTPRRPRPLQR